MPTNVTPFTPWLLMAGRLKATSTDAGRQPCIQKAKECDWFIPAQELLSDFESYQAAERVSHEQKGPREPGLIDFADVMSCQIFQTKYRILRTVKGLGFDSVNRAIIPEVLGYRPEIGNRTVRSVNHYQRGF
jgi:hypothetical protein